MAASYSFRGTINIFLLLFSGFWKLENAFCFNRIDSEGEKNDCSFINVNELLQCCQKLAEPEKS